MGRDITTLALRTRLHPHMTTGCGLLDVIASFAEKGLSCNVRFIERTPRKDGSLCDFNELSSIVYTTQEGRKQLDFLLVGVGDSENYRTELAESGELLVAEYPIDSKAVREILSNNCFEGPIGLLGEYFVEETYVMYASTQKDLDHLRGP